MAGDHIAHRARHSRQRSAAWHTAGLRQPTEVHKTNLTCPTNRSNSWTWPRTRCVARAVSSRSTTEAVSLCTRHAGRQAGGRRRVGWGGDAAGGSLVLQQAGVLAARIGSGLCRANPSQPARSGAAAAAVLAKPAGVAAVHSRLLTCRSRYPPHPRPDRRCWPCGEKAGRRCRVWAPGGRVPTDRGRGCRLGEAWLLLAAPASKYSSPRILTKG